MQPNLIDLDDEAYTTINPFISHPGNPSIPVEAPVTNPLIPASSDATTLLGNTMTAVVSEFKKMREPKLTKLKGGTTANASLFFTSWVKDARAVIAERSMSNFESLQLVKDYTEGKARAQVEFYLASTSNPTFEGLIQDLAKSFQSGEDEATIKRDFYSRMQLNKESVDDFADVLQLLARKILNVDSSFQSLLNKSLCQQLANGLKDPSHGISAQQILKQQPEISFVAFRSDLANILGCRARGVGAKGALCSAVSAESPEAPVPAKRRRTQEDDSTIATQISMCIKDNQELHRKLDALDPTKMVEAVTHAVASGYQKGFHKSNPFVKSSNPFQTTNTNQPQSGSSSQFGRPYLGQQREPQLTPGADGNLNPALSCKYCKDTGHDVGNCAKVKRKEALKAAAGGSKCTKTKKLGRPGSGDRESGHLPKHYDPKQFLGKRVYNDTELEMLRTTVTCKTLTETERYHIMEQAVAPCPEIIMSIKGHRIRALLDMGSEVTLMNESYYTQNIEQLILTVEQDHLNAHNLFNLKGVEDGCVPLTKYFAVDIQVGGRLVHDVGVLVKADTLALTDSNGKTTRAPAILGCNLIRKGMEEYIRDHGQTSLELFECPKGVDPLYFSTLCVYFYAERQRLVNQAKEKTKRDVSVNSTGVGDGLQGSRPAKNTDEPTQATQSNRPKTSGQSKKKMRK